MKTKDPLLQKKNIMLFILLFLFWIILTPNITLESVLVGLIISFGIVIFSKELVFSEKETTLYKVSNLCKFISFLSCLIVEIIKSNIQIAKIVLTPSLPISPRFVKVPIKLKKDFNKVLYGNAITLTPGTLTVDIVNNEYLIHALTEETAKGLIDSSIEKHVIELEVE